MKKSIARKFTGKEKIQVVNAYVKQINDDKPFEVKCKVVMAKAKDKTVYVNYSKIKPKKDK